MRLGLVGSARYLSPAAKAIFFNLFLFSLATLNISLATSNSSFAAFNRCFCASSSFRGTSAFSLLFSASDNLDCAAFFSFAAPLAAASASLRSFVGVGNLPCRSANSASASSFVRKVVRSKRGLSGSASSPVIPFLSAFISSIVRPVL